MSSRLLLVLTGAALCFGQNAADPNPAYRKIEDVPGLPRVLLIGDSISIGYTEPVRAALSGKANVHRIPMNGATTEVGLKNLENWLGAAKWDVIHFNFGLHDLKIMDGGQHQVPAPQYERNLRAIVQRFKKTGARLIWVRSGFSHSCPAARARCALQRALEGSGRTLGSAASTLLADVFLRGMAR